MAIAGIAWGIYSLAGKSSRDPVASNARSFLWSSPLAILLMFVAPTTTAATGRGIALALISGAITSGLGYAIWYRALPRLSMIQAAVAQLTVPIIAAVAAIGLLNEHPSMRLLLSGAAVLSGVGIVLWTRSRATQR
jgi:drug/metabolite transporter (DMT)-like permease